MIWPEHEERRQLFRSAAEVVKSHSLNLVEGDGITLLKDIVQQTPPDSAVCIFHTHVANQFPEESKQELLRNIHSIGQTREVFHIYNNMWDPLLHLDYYMNGEETNRIIGKTDGHGRMFTWEL